MVCITWFCELREWRRRERQRGITMSETKTALYFGAVFSTLFRALTYIFLRVVLSFLLCVFWAHR